MSAGARTASFFEPGEVRVKICGITNADDAALALNAGADALGINLFPGSKRHIALDDAAEWLRDIPVTRVAVVVNASDDEVRSIRESGCFEAIQFHGDESPEFCAAAEFPVWVRAVRVRGEESLLEAETFRTPHLLLDAFSVDAYGGTGLSVERTLAAQFVNFHPDRRVVLAGGLVPENVAAAVREVRPAAVDVAGGVEMAENPRRKDPDKIRAFVSAAKNALASAR